MKKKKILFFTPTSCRTGAEMALWNLLRYMDPSKYDMALSSYADGPLLKCYPAHIPTSSFYGSLDRERFRKFVDSAAAFFQGQNRTYYEWQYFKRIHKKFKPDVWYLNTNTLVNPLKFVMENRIPCIVHAHELLETLYSFDRQHMERIVQYPFLVIACSEAARRVMHTLGRTERIEICHEPVDIQSLKPNESQRLKIRRSFGIPDNAFTWAMSGFYSPRKNPTGFLSLAQKLMRIRPDAYFLWLGGGNNDLAIAEFLHKKTIELGLEKHVFWNDAKIDDYSDFLHAADGFVLTSYEESFSMVTVEALSLGKPVVALNCGGVSEYLDKNIGILVDLWNQEGLIDAMLLVMEGKFAFDKEAALRKAESFEAKKITIQWQSILESYL